MLTLYHAAPSRSSRVITLIDEMGIGDKITVKHVNIPRRDGTGARDPSNPHPEGKVPLLDHDGTLISETGAIMLYLLELFPNSLAPKPGDPKRGEFLTWMYWYGSVMEPVIVFAALEMNHPGLASTFRDHAAAVARIRAALEKGPWLMGDTYTAADLGYGPQAVIDVLNRIRGPFNLSTAALAAAEAAVRDTQHTEKCRVENARWRDWLATALAELGVPSDTSTANFILARFSDEAEASACDEHLRSAGIIVRKVAGYGLPNCLRITVGDESACRRVAHAVAQFKGAM